MGRAREEEGRDGDQEPRAEDLERREPEKCIMKMTGLYRKENLVGREGKPLGWRGLGRVPGRLRRAEKSHRY